VPEQHAVDADRLGRLGKANDILHRVKAAVKQEVMLALGLVDGDFHELDIFVVGGGRLGNEQRAPEAELDVAADVVTDAGLVETLQIRAVARDDHITEPMPALPCPFLGLILAVFLRHRSAAPLASPVAVSTRRCHPSPQRTLRDRVGGVNAGVSPVFAALTNAKISV
jgi:hypothetical protein